MTPSPTDNLARLLADSAARHPGRAAVRLDDQVTTYAELADSAARVSTLLRENGVRPGDRVGVLMPNVPMFAALYYGILQAGAIVVPMNPLLRSGEIAYHLTDARAALVLAWHEQQEEAAAGALRAGGLPCLPVEPAAFTALLTGYEPDPGPAPRRPEDTAVLIYTSGTTGRPKGAELTHLNLLRNVEVSNATLLRLTPEDVLFGGLPLFHSFGQTVGLNCAVAAGACLTLLARFDAGRALDVLERDGVTVLAAVPTMYAALLNHPQAAGRAAALRLRLCASGGAALPVEVLHAFEAVFGCPVLEGYGLSETSPVASFNHPDGPRRPGTVGSPVEGVRMRVQDAAGTELADGEVGELAISGHNVMKGYWRRPRETAEALSGGWFRTGDLGVRDPDGLFRVVGRKKEMIIRGGFNVYPREIEEVLYEHPAVAEAAVLGIPHPLLGEEITAVLALKPGAEATPDELRQFVRARVAPYKYPRLVRIVASLPKGPTGKILKREIEPPALDAEDGHAA